MKSFRVRLTHSILIEFDDDRASEKSARHVAERCLSSRAYVGDSGLAKTLGMWRAKLVNSETVSVEEEEA